MALKGNQVRRTFIARTELALNLLCSRNPILYKAVPGIGSQLLLPGHQEIRFSTAHAVELAIGALARPSGLVVSQISEIVPA